MMVRAKQKCFVYGVRRRVGDVFEFPGETLPHYLAPFVEGEAASAASPEPTTHAGRKLVKQTQMKDFDAERNSNMRAQMKDPVL